MNEKDTSQLKNYILIIMGLVISIAGVIYIIIQYGKLISEPTAEEETEQDERVFKKLRGHFKQVYRDEGTSPELIDEGDLSIELSE